MRNLTKELIDFLISLDFEDSDMNEKPLKDQIENLRKEVDYFLLKYE